jgi:hypothetical protein
MTDKNHLRISMDNKIKVMFLTIVIIALYSFRTDAAVTIGNTVNGVTHVSCTGGCSFSSGGWGSTNVCDSGGQCVSVWGTLKEGPFGEAER